MPMPVPRYIATAIALGALIVALAAMVLGRSGTETASRASTDVDWVTTLAERAGDGFERPSGPWALDLPSDHGDHPKFRAESWQISAHLRHQGGGETGVQFQLLRLGIVPPDAGLGGSIWDLREVYRGHMILGDGSGGPARAEERFGRGIPTLTGYDRQNAELRLDNWTVRFEPGGRIALEASAAERRVELRLTPVKPAVAADREGADIPFRGYAITRLNVEGRLRTEGGDVGVTGLAWLDHLWGDLPLPATGPIAWDRLQLQLDDGTDLSVLRSRRRDGRGIATVEGFVVGPEGDLRRLAPETTAMEATRNWQAEDEGPAYPLDWTLSGPGLDLDLAPPADDRAQSFVVPVWTGMVAARGRVEGRPVTGIGTLLLTGYGAR